MSRPGISMVPAGIDRAASLAAARALAIDEVARQISAVSLAGLEPSTLSRTVGALERSSTLARRASGITGQQGPALRRRAQLARAADAGGGAMAIKPWDPAKWMSKITMNSLDQYSNLLKAETTTRKSDLKRMYNSKGPMGRWYRSRFGSWKEMRTQYRAINVERRELLRKIDRFNVKRRAIESAKKQGGSLWNKTGKKLMDKLPFGKGGGGGLGKKLLGWAGKAAGKAIGPVTAIVSGVAKGESIETIAKRTAAAVAGLAVDVAVGAVGGAICAGVAVGTGGVGAVACPAIVGATAAVASIATTAVINHQIDKSEKPKPKPRTVRPGKAVPSPAL